MHLRLKHESAAPATAQTVYAARTLGTAIAAPLVLALVILDGTLFVLFGALRFDAADLCSSTACCAQWRHSPHSPLLAYRGGCN